MDADNIPYLEKYISENLFQIDNEYYNFEFIQSGSIWTKEEREKLAAAPGLSRMFPLILKGMFSELDNFNIICHDWLFSLLGASGFKKALTEYLTPRPELNDKFIANLQRAGLLDRFNIS